MDTVGCVFPRPWTNGRLPHPRHPRRGAWRAAFGMEDQPLRKSPRGPLPSPTPSPPPAARTTNGPVSPKRASEVTVDPAECAGRPGPRREGELSLKSSTQPTPEGPGHLTDGMRAPGWAVVTVGEGRRGRWGRGRPGAGPGKATAPRGTGERPAVRSRLEGVGWGGRRAPRLLEPPTPAPGLRPRVFLRPRAFLPLPGSCSAEVPAPPEPPLLGEGTRARG